MTGMIFMLLTTPIVGELSTLMNEAKKEFFTREEIIEMLGESVVNVCQKMDEIKKEEDERFKKEKSEPSSAEMNCKGDFHPEAENLN